MLAYGKTGNGSEMGTANGNWKQKWKQQCTNHWCSVFFADWWQVCFVITLVLCLGGHIILVFMSHVLCLLSCALWLDIQCGWLVLMWRTILQSSLVYMWEGLGMRLVAIWPWEYFVLQWDQGSYSYSLITRPSLTSSFVVCDANDGFIPMPYFSQVPGYAIPTPYRLQYLPDVC